MSIFWTPVEVHRVVQERENKANKNHLPPQTTIKNHDMQI